MLPANQVPAPRGESTASAARRESRVPGESGFWVIILGDLTAFALLFCVFMYYRGHGVELYADSQDRLNRLHGALNVVLLLTSSWCVVEGIEAFRHRVGDRARCMFGAALLLGAGFVLVKVLEYGEKVRDGIVATTSEFFMFYYVLTGIHLLHLLVGLGVLAWMRARSNVPSGTQREIELLECGGLYWHMVDLLWVALFTLLYLVR